MLETIFQALATGLSLWQSKEGRKYLDRLIELKREYYAEFNKKRPDDAVLDNITLELQHISSSFAQAVLANSQDK